MNRNDLERLTKEELIDLVLRMQRPDKNSRNSSKPPSTDRKEQRENSKPGGAKPGHEGHTRRLADNPDAVEEYSPTHCERCVLPFSDDATRELIGEYDEIELPPVRPFVKRHRRFAIRCACCAKPTPARLPPVAQGTPFGPNIHALAVYLKTMQLFSYERLSAIFRDRAGAYWLMWGLRVSTPKRSMWRVAQFDTLRLHLIKIAARVVQMKTMIRVHLPTSCPAQDVIRFVHARLVT